LEALRQDGFRHRSISVVANDLGLHRVTVTEYLRGWVIRYLHEHDFDLPQICQALAGGAQIENQEKFRDRISQYAASIRRRIEEGLQKNEAQSAMRYVRFKNLPNEFEQDLNLLIEEIKNERRR
jgi:hypothetical protein